MQAAPTGCGAALRAEADTESFPANAATLTQATGAAFVTAATHLCTAGGLRPADLTRFHRLLVRASETANGVVIYDDAEQGEDALILEYGFTNGAAPAAPAIETALRCWKDPARAGCDQGGE
jgi:hypothetical protein